MPRYRRVAAVSTTSVRDLRAVKDAEPEVVDVGFDAIDEEPDALVVEETPDEPVAEEPPKRKRGRPRKKPAA